jgi:thiol:disulfide interchange protein DsbD
MASMSRAFRSVVGLGFALAALATSAAPVRTEHVEAELVSERAALAPGQTLTVALRLKMDRGWHTYWLNPGDSGLPTTLAWTLPSGIAAGPIEWPAPSVLTQGPLTNYGYEGEVLLLTQITLLPQLQSGSTVALNARADWLVCKEICIPEGADLSLALPVAPTAPVDARWAEPIAKARAALPGQLSGWTIAAVGNGAKVELTLAPTDSATQIEPGVVHFFPSTEGRIEASGKQALTRDGSTLKLTLPVASQRVGAFTRVAGVLAADNGFGGTVSAATIDVPLTGSIIAGPAAGQTATRAPAFSTPVLLERGNELTLSIALGFALLGGVLLNLMPCVFPVLSLKVLGFATHGDSRRAMRMHGAAFASGVVVSFWLLAAVLLALRAAGEQLGWGFQLQSPAVVIVLAALFFVLALNLSGVFESSGLLPSALATWSARNAYVNDFLSGVLAVVVASPCSAPFMGAALGYALTESVAATFAVFTALGVGMAIPYGLLAFFPAWREKLPKPGPWMLRLRQVLAFPLYATVIWLAWVLGAQLDNDAVMRLAAMLLLLAIALWAWQTTRTGGARGWVVAAIACVAAASAVIWPVLAAAGMSAEPAQKPALATAQGPWQNFAPERIAQLTGIGRPVFVDFTAAWCVTCQVNKRLVLNSDAVQQAFVRADVVLMRADWTRRDPMITKALAALGRSGVPVYVLYRPGRDPLVLPEVLQKSIITDALAML